MNRTLWKSNFVEGRLLLACCCIILFGFNWVYVWASSLVKLGMVEELLNTLPPELVALSGVEDTKQIATTAGRLGLGYVDPVVLFASGVWAIARGSDAVSGPLGRGTLEMILSQPVRRITLLGIHSAITIAGAVLLALCAFGGTAMGLATVTLEQSVEINLFVAPAINVFSLTFFVAGLTTFVSSFDTYRGRTVGIVSGFYIFAMVIQLLVRTVDSLEWLKYFTFLAAYEPVILVTEPENAWTLSLQYNGILLGLGALAFLAGGVVFCRRDLPAPL